MSPADLLASSSVASSSDPSGVVLLPHRPPPHSSASPSIVITAPTSASSLSSPASSSSCTTTTTTTVPTPLLPPAQHFLSAMADHFTSNFFTSGDFLSAAFGHSSTGAAFMANSGLPLTAGIGGGQLLARNSTKTLKCPKCNWHYKYQETLEIHMREKHADAEVLCLFCLENQAHPKLARGETYSCGYKPYRCEVCKYSTTTKGNLSIHMQSDKHVHAVQEMPQSLAGSSHLLLGQFGHAGLCGLDAMPNSTIALRAELSNMLQCLICLNFSADSLADMQAHLEQERGQVHDGDIAALHGFFQCLLCPYSTNLKANFQLHTRTDKHIQRVQLINHLREGSAVLGVSEQFARLGSLKSAVQVRCQPCEEVFACIASLRDHCLNSRLHLANMAVREEADALAEFLGQALIRCGRCPFETDAVEHANQHQCPSSSSSSPLTTSAAGADDSPSPRLVKAASSILHSTTPVGKTKLDDDDGPIIEGWQEMDAFLVSKGLAQRGKTQTPFNVDQMPEAALSKDTLPTTKQCPLCSVALGQPYEQELQKHIAEEHKIPAGIAQRLAKTEVGQNEQQAVAGEQPPTGEQRKSPSGEMLNNIASGTSPPSSSTAATAGDDHHPFASGASNFTHLLPIFPHQCPQCSIAFRTSEQLQAHALAHSPAKFRLWHRCEMLQCATNAGWDSSADDGTAVPSPTALYSSKRALERHQTTAHQNDSGHFCDICVDGQRFESDNALMAHFNTEQHLQKIFNPASSAPCSSASSSSTPSSAASKGQKRPSSSASSSSKQLPYTCNVCAQSFGQPGTLDTHLRSMAHAQRMSRLADLVQNGELEPSKPIFEQPEPHPAQRSIGEVAAERKSKQNMGKLAAAGGAPHHHNNHHHHHHHHNHASSTSATLIQPTPAESGMGVPSSLSNNAVVDGNSNGGARGGSNTTSAFDELFKPSNGSWGTNNGAITHQQQQLMAAQMIAQMFATAQHQQQQQHSGDSSSDQAAATAAAAAAAATTLMATAQMAAQMAAASGGFGLLEMFGQPKPSSAELNHSHAAAAEAAHASSTDCGANAASVTNGCDELNNNMNNTNSNSSSRLSPMRASAPPNGRRQQRTTALVADGSGPPRAKRARAGSTPAVAAAAAQQPQRITTNGAGGLNGSGRTSRESGVDCLSTSSSLQPAPVQQQPPMDLVSVLQALAASSTAAGAATTSPSLLGGASAQFPFGSVVAAGASPATDAGFLMAAAAMAAAGGNIGGPSSNGTMPQVHPPTPSASLNNNNNNYSNYYSCANGSNAPSPSPQKRARTRIADEQVKILRQYFDINNSPSEEQIKEMAQKAQLPEKVIKHWFRNTLFKERQRDKDSPYNFSNPPSMGIDLAIYHRTGEARIIPVSGGCTRDAQKEEGGEEREGEEVLINNNSSITKSEMVEDEKEEERPKAMPEGRRSTREQEEEEAEMAPEGRKDEEEEEEDEHHPSEEREETKVTRSMAEEEAKADEDDDDDHHNRHEQEEEEEEEEEDEAKNALDTANFLANIGKTAQQQQQQLMMPPLFPFFGGASGGGAGSASTPQMMDFASMFSAFPFQSFGQMASSSAAANASNGFSPSASAAAAQQAQQQFLPPAGSNNSSSSTFGHLFSGQNLLLNSLMSSSQQQQQQQAQAVQPASASAQQQQNLSNLGTPPVNMSQMGVVPSTSAAVVPSGAATTTAAATAMGSGRRANRTRFTDFQLRTLQQFFDKQAYPKDDDLEMLSKKMGLSPRVIVVWFQNARQKARKVFEQQPHLLLQANLSAAGGHESVFDDQQHQQQQHHHVQHVQHHLHPLHAAAAAANNQNAVTEQQQQQQRFVRTSSANFQCVRCKLVFQRYLELIQHQQRVCYAGDEQHLLKSEQHGPMMDGESEEQQQQQQHNSSGGSGRTSSNSTNNNNNCNTTTAGAEAMFTMEQSTQELLRQLVAAQHNLLPLPPPPGGEDHQQQQQNEIKAEVDASSLLNKRCATCDQLLLPSRHSLQKHLCRQCHAAAEEAAGGGVGTLPRAKGMPPTASAAGEPLDLSVSSAASGTQSSLNNNNNNNGIIASSMLDNHEEWMPGGGRSCGANSLSPTAFSLSEEGANEHYATGGAGGDVSASSQVCSPLGSYCSTSGMSGATLMPLFQSLAQQQHSPTSGGQQLMNSNGSGSCSKRFRTHLTPMQVFIMKSLFNDYKTPSMQECDALGQKIGLHKRVVQVWFQNARAKERKSVGGGGSSTGSGAESSDDTSVVVPHCDLAGQRCHLCGVEFGARLSMQEHIFGTEHVERVREQGAQMRGVGASAPPQAENGGTADKEKRAVKVPLSGSGGDEAAAAAADVPQTTTTTAQQQIDAMLAAQQQLAASQHLPYELMYAAAAASGLSSGALPALLYDPSVFGTPVPALKIPKGVMQQILADMAQRRASTLFTQDGLALAELAEKVEADDFREAGTVDLEVGWGCTQCGNVFQQSEQLQNHQKLICAGAEGNFKLIQTHYQCNRCSEQFGTQSEFQTHCQTGGHHKFKQCSGVTTTVVQKSNNNGKISGGQGVGD